MPTNTFCSDTLYVRTDPGSLSSFAEECSFGELVIGFIPLKKIYIFVCHIQKGKRKRKCLRGIAKQRMCSFPINDSS